MINWSIARGFAPYGVQNHKMRPIENSGSLLSVFLFFFYLDFYIMFSQFSLELTIHWWDVFMLSQIFSLMFFNMNDNSMNYAWLMHRCVEHLFDGCHCECTVLSWPRSKIAIPLIARSRQCVRFHVSLRGNVIIWLMVHLEFNRGLGARADSPIADSLAARKPRSVVVLKQDTGCS